MKLIIPKGAGGNPHIIYNNAILNRPKDYEIRDGVIDFKIEFEDGDHICISDFLCFKRCYECIGLSFIVVDPKETNNKFESEPKNNDGREICYWCNGATKEVDGFSGKYNICINCGK